MPNLRAVLPMPQTNIDSTRSQSADTKRQELVDVTKIRGVTNSRSSR